VISELSILAFTHKTNDISDLGYLSLEQDKIVELSPSFKDKFQLSEFFLLNTCNRVEMIYIPQEKSVQNSIPIREFIQTLNPKISPEILESLVQGARNYRGHEALNHLLRVSCSLDSLVVGEKEILAQVREAFELGRKMGNTGDRLRLVMDRVVKTSKEVYTQTQISSKPISVVSIAFRKLKSLKLREEANILLIGAGKTNTLFSKYLVKHGFKNFHVFNRTLSKAELLAKEIQGKAYALPEIYQFKKGFDLIVICTDSTQPLIYLKDYHFLLKHCNNSKDQKVIIDLSVPSNIDPKILEEYPVHFIDIQSLQALAAENMDERYKELFFAEKIIEENLEEFNTILKIRKVELAMKEVPQMIKEIKEMALSTIFAKDVDRLDEDSKETLQKVLDYMEKKYISIPMVLAKDILVNS